MTVADRIKDKRKELNMSQTELAKKANYTDKTSVSKIEHSGNDISMKQIQRIAIALGVSASYLMGWEQENGYVASDTDNEMKHYIECLQRLPLESRKMIYEQIEFQLAKLNK